MVIKIFFTIIEKEGLGIYKLSINGNLLIFGLVLIGLVVIFSYGMNNVAAASGDIVFVNSSGGSDTNDGSSWLLAKKSIKNATGTVNINGSVNIADGTYSGSSNSNILIARNMKIIGESRTNTIINGLKSGPSIFYVSSGVNATIINLSFINCFSEDGGAIYNDNGNLNVINSNFINNNVFGGSGGAIFSYGGNLTVTNSIFSNNTANLFGGAIYSSAMSYQGGNFYYTTSNINNCTFTNNYDADQGGAIATYMVIINVNNCSFINNMAFTGGAINNAGNLGNNNNLTVTNSTFMNNTAVLGGGGAICNVMAWTVIHFSTIIGNTANQGNSINCQGGSVNATQNWWGSNSGPSTSDNIGSVICNPWMVLTITASPNFILNNGNSTITLDLLHDSNNTIYDPAYGHVPDGIPVNFITTLGTIMSQLNIVNGIASSTLSCASLGGTAYIIGSADNQSVLTQVLLIDTVPPTASANPAGGLYNTTKNVYLSMSEQGTIYYTTDGSTPTYNSDRYNSHLIITNTTTLKFFAMDLSGNTSQVYTEIYTIDTTAPTAKSNTPSGYYNTTKNVTLSMSESGNIYYTLNGTTPTTTSTLYTIPLTINSTTTLKFLAVDLAGNKSPVYTQTYTIDKTAPKVSSTTPANNQVNVSRKASILIKFTENIKTSSNFVKITMKNLTTGKTVSITATITNNTLTIKPSSTLTANTAYQVNIPTGAVKDYAGNNLAATHTIKFKTGT